MQRPHPTHPAEPNWSTHEPNLCVSHCRYRVPGEVRILPPWIYENSIVKQESHFRQRSARVPRKSVISSIVVQKQVGQTSVQLLQLIQRDETSSPPRILRIAIEDLLHLGHIYFAPHLVSRGRDDAIGGLNV